MSNIKDNVMTWDLSKRFSLAGQELVVLAINETKRVQCVVSPLPVLALYVAA